VLIVDEDSFPRVPVEGSDELPTEEPGTRAGEFGDAGGELDKNITHCIWARLGGRNGKLRN
jgi:hypothetical protein